MVNPIQIKVISRFIVQIIEFKKILDKILLELKEVNNESLYISKKNNGDSSRKNGNVDFFTSIMMSFSNDMPGQLYGKDNNDMFKSIMEDDKMMKESVRQFNLECEQKMKVLTENKKDKEG
jgi:hypothetical protein